MLACSRQSEEGDQYAKTHSKPGMSAEDWTPLHGAALLQNQCQRDIETGLMHTFRSVPLPSRCALSITTKSLSGLRLVKHAIRADQTFVRQGSG